MQLSINDLTLIIKFENNIEEKLIKKFITFRDTSACFFGGSFHAERAKDVCFGKDVKGYFVCYAGFAREIMVFAKQNNIPITSFEDKRTHFDFQKKEWSYDELKKFYGKHDYEEHQIRSLAAMIKTNTGIVVAPTSAGKSTIMAAYIKLINMPVLIIVNKVLLGIQLRNDFIENGIDCGICSGKGFEQGECMVSTIQSVYKIGDLDRFQCVLFDECHNVSAGTFQDFLKQFGCPLKFGFSASPSRDGDYLGYAKIRQFLGSPITKIESEELIKNNVMAKPHIYLVENKCTKSVAMENGAVLESHGEYADYATAYHEEIINGEKRNNNIKKICEKYGGGVLIVVNIVDHGLILENMLSNSKFISGETPLDERMDAIKKFDNGEIPYLIGSTILQEGISITHMKAMVLACGGKSNVAVLQKIGRSLRYKQGEKTDVDFYDFIDNAEFLLKHSKRRVTLYKKAGYNDMKLLDEELKLIDKKNR